MIDSRDLLGQEKASFMHVLICNLLLCFSISLHHSLSPLLVRFFIAGRILFVRDTLCLTHSLALFSSLLPILSTLQNLLGSVTFQHHNSPSEQSNKKKRYN